jgi:hypothetical protein
VCALCGVLGGADHWTDAVVRPGVFTRTGDPLERRRERQRRVSLANRILAVYGMSLSDWRGTTFVLSTATGKSEIVENLTHLWSVAERLSGRVCDPLDPALLVRLDTGHA